MNKPMHFVPTPAPRRETAPAGWVESLERSMAEIEAGQTVPIELALDRLRASIARMEAKRAGTDKI